MVVINVVMNRIVYLSIIVLFSVTANLGFSETQIDAARRLLPFSDVEIESIAASESSLDLAKTYGSKLEVRCFPDNLDVCLAHANYDAHLLFDKSFLETDVLELVERHTSTGEARVDGTRYLGFYLRALSLLGAEIRGFRQGISLHYMFVVLQNGAAIEVSGRTPMEYGLLIDVGGGRVTIDCASLNETVCLGFLQRGARVLLSDFDVENAKLWITTYPGQVTIRGDGVSLTDLEILAGLGARIRL
jgi:hypothetical protein